MSDATQNLVERETNRYAWVGWIVTLLVPVTLVMAAVRLLISPIYLIVEYNTPGFPADPFGFTKEERLHWGTVSVKYLVNEAGIEYLADLRFPEGQQVPQQSCQFMDDCTRLYNDRELEHMLDVKNVLRVALNVWYASVLGLAILWVWARLGHWSSAYRQGLRRGGLLTVFLLLGIILFVFLAFGVIFVAFHEIFFEAGTWTFYYSDTLIRLFPERFWRDTFIAVGLLAGGAGYLLAWMVGREQRRNLPGEG